MPSSFPNGVSSAATNVRKNQTNKNSLNRSVKGPREVSTQSTLRESRGTKSFHPHETRTTTHVMDTSHPSTSCVTHSREHSCTTFVMPSTEGSVDHTDQCVTTFVVPPASSPHDTTTVSSIPEELPHTTPASFQPPIYDAALTQAYMTHLQHYMAGACNLPNCPMCSLQYAPNVVPVSMYPNMTLPSLSTPNASNYVIMGHDTNTQKQMYHQIQLALSNLNLNAPNGTASATECALGFPVIRPSASVMTNPHHSVGSMLPESQIPNGAATALSLVSPSPACDHPNLEVGSTQQVFNPHIMSGALNHTNDTPIDPGRRSASGFNVSSCGSNAVNGNVSLSDPNEYPPNSHPVRNNGALWTGNNYFGSNAFWYPNNTYANYPQPYYPINNGLNFAEPLLPTVLSRAYRNATPTLANNKLIPTTLQDFSLSTSVYANNKTTPPLNHLTTYGGLPTSGGTTCAPQWYNPLAWQMFLNTLALSRNSSCLLPTSTVIPYTVALDRTNEDYRRTTCHTRNIPSKGFDLMELANLNLSVNPVELDDSLLYRARYFVIKSDCEYNVHQSIRHGIWCSTRAGNLCLDEAFQSVQASHHTSNNRYDTPIDRSLSLQTSAYVTERPGHVLLFFSIRSVGHMSGVAEMIGPVNTQKRCSIWQDARFRGEIPVRWLYIKNVPNNLIKHITVESYDNRSVTVLRDTSEIRPASKGEELLRIIHNYGQTHVH